ncbi:MULTISPECIES: hypothetical protein [Shewanella]|jgi:hypothetical protein|uniref:DUF5666 domain-containing protein n=2 Tax=Shewanella TaxID=22 RepID=A0AAJ1BIG7_9GAMM|nr:MULTISPECIES: hypothetical protein [Shewanella]AZQ10514.1 hypothetical protein STH12_01393 [Shewanella khirikhana]MCH4294497.1 hypothetical protein [Shewanella zhuhaiensis]
MRHGHMLRTMVLSAAIAGSLALAPQALAQKHLKQNLQDMVSASANIIAGQVLSVTDGFDNKNRPYTEITIKVGQDVKGKYAEGATYSFRQFGLLKPKSMGNGKVYLGVSPEGFAKWQVGEQVIAFMNPSLGGGLNSTVGLEQGKFVVSNGKVQNQLGNLGLFEDMTAQGLSPEEANLLTTNGAVDSAAFMGLVGKLAGGQ